MTVKLADLEAFEASNRGTDQFSTVLKEVDLYLNVEACGKWYLMSDKIEPAFVIGVVAIHCRHCERLDLALPVSAGVRVELTSETVIAKQTRVCTFWSVDLTSMSCVKEARIRMCSIFN